MTLREKITNLINKYAHEYTYYKIEAMKVQPDFGCSKPPINPINEILESINSTIGTCSECRYYNPTRNKYNYCKVNDINFADIEEDIWYCADFERKSDD